MGKKNKRILNIFLSYTHRDGKKYIDSCIDLIKKSCSKAASPIECHIFYDENFYNNNENFWDIAQEYYKASDIAIMLVTPEICNSDSISTEIEYLNSYGKKIVPVIFEGDSSCLPFEIRNVASFDCTNGSDETLENALASLFEQYSVPLIKGSTNKPTSSVNNNKQFKTVVIEAVKKGISSAVEKLLIACFIVVAIIVVSIILGKNIDWISLFQKLFNLI